MCECRANEYIAAAYNNVSLSNTNRVKYFKLAVPAYFLLLGIIDLVGGIISKGRVEGVSTLSFIVFATPFFIRKSWVYLIFGIIYAMMSAVLILGVFVYLVKYFNGERLPNPLLFFGVGLPFGFLSFTLSLVMIYMSLDHSGKGMRLKDPF